MGQYLVANSSNDKVVLDSSYMTALGLTGTSGGAGDIASLTKVDAGGNTYTGAKAFAMRMMGVHDGNDCATIATDVDKIITASPEVKYSFTTNYKEQRFLGQT